MPRSSVFVRLNWPSKSDDSSFESEGSPHVQSTLPSPAYYPHVEKTASSSSGDSFERKTPDLECSAASSFSPSAGDIRGEKCSKNIASKHLRIRCHVKPTVDKGTEPPHWVGGIQSSSSCTATVPSYYGNQTVCPSSGPCRQHSDKGCHSVTPDTDVSNVEGAVGVCKKVGTGSLKGTKPKTKPKPRHLANKNRRISRSLSASCVSVSTNTDPRDFVELAKVSATLPIRRRVKDPKIIAARSTENKAVSCSLDLEDICQVENSFALKTEEKNPVAVEETFFQKIVYPCAHTPNSAPLSEISKEKSSKHEDVYHPSYSYSLPNSPTVHNKLLPVDSDEYSYYLAYSGSLPNTPTVYEKPITVASGDHGYQLKCSHSLPNSPTVHEKPIIPQSECYTVDNSDDTIRGYIELPTYVPSGIYHPCSSSNDEVVAPYASLQDDKHPILSLLSSTLDKLSVEDAPYIDDEMFTALGVQQDLPVETANVHSDDKDETVLNLSLDDGGFQQEGILRSEEDCNLKEQFASSSSSVFPDTTPTVVVHDCSFPQDKLDLVPESPEFSRKSDVGDFIKECGKEDDVAVKGFLGTDQTFPPIHWSPIPKHHFLQAAARRHLDKDISIESCPDVVLQTLESEGISMPKSHKKTVTFLLPPEHWDSLISLRENNLGGYPQSGYAELDSALLPPNGQDPYRNTPSPGLHGVPQDRYVQWRDPDLHEVIDFLSNPNNVVKANAAAYLQHLCYMDDPTKQKTRILGGIPPLVALLSHDLPELHRNACGALRNLSYGRQNDENKRAIKDASGIPALVRLLRKTPDNEIKELVTGILWNLSSCEDLKHSIIDDALTVTVSHVIIPCSGWDGGEVERDPNVDVWWSTVFKNASGVLRNVSSAGEYARTKLRQCHGLVDSLLTVIKSAIAGASHDNKSVENCVCILRNLSYRCQEVEDPNYDKNQPPTQSRATATAKGDNLGCFGGSRKKKEAVGGAMKETSTGQRSTGPRTEPLRGMELLWQPEVVVGPYLALLSDCSNPETLEAAAGALQNLAACYWQPSIDVRAAVRKEKGLPILVELLRMEVDRVVCAVATALRNLAIDQRNKELIGKYAMRELVQKLPSGNTHDTGTSDETIAAVLATLNEVIKKNAEFSRSLLDFGGVDRLVNMTRLRGRYSVRVVKFASQVLFSMWGHQELREVYKKQGWKEQDFVSKSVAARNASGGGANSPTANNTLNRPMASQGGTRYEDKTIQRGQGKAHQQREQLPMSDMGYGGDGGIVPQAGGVRLYPPVQGKPGEPVYAKVNRDKKRNRQYDGLGPQYGTLGADDWSGPIYSGSPTATPNFNNTSHNNNNNTNNNGVVLDSAEGQAGDSWV